MKTLSYIYGQEEEIKIGNIYYFGQLWNGNGDYKLLLAIGIVGIEDILVEFEVIEVHTDILKSIVKVTGIC